MMNHTQHQHTEIQDPRTSMNRMYKYTRHVYDASRKYYLLGRDTLIKNLHAKPGEHVVEVGCGTARNLIKMAKVYPEAHFYGLDASDEMLKTAHKNLSGAGFGVSPDFKQWMAGNSGANDNQIANDTAQKAGQKQIPLAVAFAQDFDPKALFGVQAQLDKIVFSYSLSMIPPWQESIDHAIDMLREGGTIHVVDFGDQAKMPKLFRSGLYAFLDKFGVHFRPEMIAYFKEQAKKRSDDIQVKSLYGGYSYLLTYTKN